jgi:predicted nucleotidyltransferase
MRCKQPKIERTMKTLATATIDATTQAAVQQFMALVKKHDYPVQQTILFGSRARGDAHEESDADVAVILSGDVKPTTTTHMALSGLAYDVLLDTGIVIQAVPVWDKQWAVPNSHTNPRLLTNIARDGVTF